MMIVFAVRGQLPAMSLAAATQRAQFTLWVIFLGVPTAVRTRRVDFDERYPDNRFLVGSRFKNRQSAC